MNVRDIRIPSERPLLSEQLAKCFEEECSFETVHKRKDGSIFPVEVSARGAKFAGKPIIVSVVRDVSERKRAEEIRSSLASIVEYSHDALLKVSLDGTILVWNKSAERVYGYTAAETVGKNISILIPKDKAPDLPLVLDAVKSGNVVDNYETVRKTKDGKLIHVSIVASPIRDESGNVVSISWTSRDITEHKRIEDSLRDSEERFRAIFQLAAIGISQMSLDGRFIRANKKLCDILGCNLEEIFKLSIQDITYPADLEYELTYLRRLIAGEISTYSIEKRDIRRDGSIIWVNVTASLVREAGKPKYFIRIVEDITKRKTAEDALRYSEERFHAVYDWAAIGISMADKNGIIIDINNALLNMLGYKREELIHRSITDITHPDDISKNMAYFNRIVSGEIDHYKIEKRYLRKDNSIVSARLTTSAVRDIKGELSFAIGMVEDITERKKAEEELLAAKSQVELYLDLMGHDFQNMNQIAIGYLELAIDALDLKGENRELLEKPLETLMRSSGLISNLKKLRAAKEKEYKYEVINVREVLADVVSEYSYMPGRDVKINYKLSSNCKVLANNLLRDVFSNIIGNSIKHSKGPLTINIKQNKIAEDGVSYCRITFEDNGPGIPDQRKCEIFERFKQPGKVKGTGMGLYIVKTLVDDYQGKIWTEDRVPDDSSKGARFIVMLPAVK